MKKLIFVILFLFLFSSNAYAINWVDIATSSDKMISVDTDSIKVNIKKDIFRCWIRIINSDGSSDLSFMYFNLSSSDSYCVRHMVHRNIDGSSRIQSFNLDGDNSFCSTIVPESILWAAHQFTSEYIKNSLNNNKNKSDKDKTI